MTNNQDKKKNKPNKKRKNYKNKPKKKSYLAQLNQTFQENPTKTFSIKKLFKAFGATNKAKKLRIVEDIEKLAEAGEIFMNQDGNFKANVQTQIHEGIVDFVNPRFAFIICEGLEEDVWVNSDDLKFALDGDKVRIKVFPKRKGRKQEGEVLEIIERRRDEFVGKIELSERYAFVIADSRKMHLDIFVPNKGVKGAKSGEKVIVKIVEWHDEKNSPVGMVKQVLGKAGEHHTEMHAILAEFDLPIKFPDEVVAEAEKISDTIPESEIKNRRDMREVLTFTIDPDNAKDFDDAISIQKIGEDHWEIGIHIADVTHYVKPNTILEEEAQKRATSVYLVDRVVPMLPEKLSNGVCSLRPNEDKLTFSAIFEMDSKAKVLKEWFGRTIIHSDRRFAYEDAQERIETGDGDLAEELQFINTLAKKMTQERFSKGAINFETTEVKFILDEDGKPIGLKTKERKDAHRLIEEFMLLANKRVAEFVFKQKEKSSEGKPQAKTMVYRIHEEPNTEKLQNFSAFAKRFGYAIALEGQALSASLNNLIERTDGTAQQDILQTLAIRTMAKARYSTEEKGHFGLAFEHYTHFTSPIRRYPDMMVHRLLQRYLDRKPSIEKGELDAQCRHSTDMEKRAADAERASIKYKQVEFMQLAEDKAYEGIVTGVTEWGIYVEITETKCEGMVRMSDIVDDFYELDAENYRVIGKKNQNIIAFGDDVSVRVKDTNLEKRTMDLIFV